MLSNTSLQFIGGMLGHIILWLKFPHLVNFTHSNILHIFQHAIFGIFLENMWSAEARGSWFSRASSDLIYRFSQHRQNIECFQIGKMLAFMTLTMCGNFNSDAKFLSIPPLHCRTGIPRQVVPLGWVLEAPCLQSRLKSGLFACGLCLHAWQLPPRATRLGRPTGFTGSA